VRCLPSGSPWRRPILKIMCGRYVRKSTRREIANWFAAEDAEGVEWGSSYNVAPQTFQPVVRLNRDTGRR
jgi:putative SOS response-associated peptidase YedK